MENFEHVNSGQFEGGISLNEPRMIDYWCEALSCTLDELVEAEAIAGPRVRDVLRQLGRQLH